MEPSFLALLYILGVETAFTPCFLPIIPVFLSVVAKSGSKRVLLTTLAFIAGITASFLIYGILASYSGSLLQGLLTGNLPTLAVGMGLTLVSLGVLMMSPLRVLFAWIPSVQPRFQKASILNSLLLGFLFSLVAAPCAATILVAAFSMVWLGSLQEPGDSIITVLVYSAGVTTPFFIMGLLTEFLGKSIGTKISRSFLVRHNETISGITIIVLGILTILSVEGHDIILVQLSARLLPYLGFISLLAAVLYSLRAYQLGIMMRGGLLIILGTSIFIYGLIDVLQFLPPQLQNEGIRMLLFLISRTLIMVNSLLLAKPYVFSLPLLILNNLPLMDSITLIAWTLGPGRRDREHLFASLYILAHIAMDLVTSKATNLLWLAPYLLPVLPVAYLSPLLPALKLSKIITGLKLLEEI
ncbi:MAG: cytochrome c biogenesis CcdA family protein [Infirmifilum sp.]|jgi:cytochrome c biogenesis protein CcdA|uniref:cytochrome c biogenesis CcdA family protein n=1 Tax=Infirmifilum TaxID=2856573 RepID=UPI003C75ABCD